MINMSTGNIEQFLTPGMRIKLTDFEGEEINIEINEEETIHSSDLSEDELIENEQEFTINVNTNNHITMHDQVISLNDGDDLQDNSGDDLNDSSENIFLQDSLEIIVDNSESSDGKIRGNVQFNCNKCNWLSDSLESMQKHSLICGRQKNAVSMLNFPVKSVAESKALSNKFPRKKLCRLCSTFFNSDSELLEHSKICISRKRLKKMSTNISNKQARNKKILGVKTATTTLCQPNKEYRCICTWCDFKANRYSDVKRHIEWQHEKKSFFPCKECSFVCQSVEDYAKHFNCFHKTDEYKHACTACSFRCNNGLDLKAHYLCAHNKQRTYSCKICGLRSQDIVKMKKHLVTLHSTSVFQCKACDFKCNMKNDYRKHLTTVHNGASGFEGECPDIQFDITDIIDKEPELPKEREPVPETDILEEQIFDEQIIDNSLSSGLSNSQLEATDAAPSEEGDVLLHCDEQDHMQLEGMTIYRGEDSLEEESTSSDRSNNYIYYIGKPELSPERASPPPANTRQCGVYIIKNNIITTTLDTQKQNS